MLSILLPICTALGGLSVLVWGKLTIYHARRRRERARLYASIAALEQETRVGVDDFDERLAVALDGVFIAADEYLSEWAVPWQDRQARAWSVPLSDIRYDVRNTILPRRLPPRKDARA